MVFRALIDSVDSSIDHGVPILVLAAAADEKVFDCLMVVGAAFPFVFEALFFEVWAY